MKDDRYLWYYQRLGYKLQKQKEQIRQATDNLSTVPIQMSLGRSTYSPVRHSYTHAHTMSPTYSYSRVTSYLDALERDETINKLRRQITDVKSVQMKYHSLLQEISLAEKDNRILQSKNTSTEQQYVNKIQKVRSATSSIQKELIETTRRLDSQEKTVAQVQHQIQSLLTELKSIQQQQQATERESHQLQQDINNSNESLTKLSSQKQQLINKKSSLSQNTKHSAIDMQTQMLKIIEANEVIKQHQEELDLLYKQLEAFRLETQNQIAASCQKNTTLRDNLQRRVAAEEGDNQHLKQELQAAEKDWKLLQQKNNLDRETLYQNITKVEEQSLILRDTLTQLDHQLQNDSTEKRYLKDISTKKALLDGQNQQLRERIKELTQFYSEKKNIQTKLMEQINKKIQKDQQLKKTIEQRTATLNQIRERANQI